MELHVQGRDATPGAAKRRAVLTALALGANRPVSLDRLCEVAWAGAPPASAVANLRSHAMGLRKSLGGRLMARSNAYELRLATGELDVNRFHRLASEGRGDLAAGDPASAIGKLLTALSLWRGRLARVFRRALSWTATEPLTYGDLSVRSSLAAGAAGPLRRRGGRLPPRVAR
ncbi:AfsR/SARP family transcriptional regulator [Micromonospora qiuiae]|uniref:AfsR/SARP family transcriptional regulator n=1 Tax=Micromonospora qiuiae TaxID=502268 RepID=UPI001950A20D|nr:BTAD domain-containing putative transcriptional regulator [Micromonospora qiuiae]